MLCGDSEFVGLLIHFALLRSPGEEQRGHPLSIGRFPHLGYLSQRVLSGLVLPGISRHLNLSAMFVLAGGNLEQALHLGRGFRKADNQEGRESPDASKDRILSLAQVRDELTLNQMAAEAAVGASISALKSAGLSSASLADLGERLARWHLARASQGFNSDPEGSESRGIIEADWWRADFLEGEISPASAELILRWASGAAFPDGVPWQPSTDEEVVGMAKWVSALGTLSASAWGGGGGVWEQPAALEPAASLEHAAVAADGLLSAISDRFRAAGTRLRMKREGRSSDLFLHSTKKARSGQDKVDRAEFRLTASLPNSQISNDQTVSHAASSGAPGCGLSWQDAFVMVRTARALVEASAVPQRSLLGKASVVKSVEKWLLEAYLDKGIPHSPRRAATVISAIGRGQVQPRWMEGQEGAVGREVLGKEGEKEDSGSYGIANKGSGVLDTADRRGLLRVAMQSLHLLVRLYL